MHASEKVKKRLKLGRNRLILFFNLFKEKEMKRTWHIKLDYMIDICSIQAC